MSQRLRSVGGSPAPFDPKWPLMGSDGEGGGGTGSGGDGGGGASGGSGDPGDGGQQPPPAPSNPPAPADTISRAEYEALEARMRAADQAKSAAEAKVKEFEQQGQSELEKAQNAATAATAEADQLKAALNEQRVSNAFLANSKHAWHSSEAALKLLDTSNVTIEQNGTVKGIDAAVEKLAKEHPYLVKVEGAPPPPSGDPKDGKHDKDKAALDRAALEKKYPALRR